MEVSYVKYGVANRYPDRIEVNRHLKKYPSLLNQIMEHEMKHTNEALTLYDFKHDLTCDSQIDQYELIRFIFKYPSSWTQFLPITISWKDNMWNINIDYNKCIIYFISLLLMGGAVWIGMKL